MNGREIAVGEIFTEERISQPSTGYRWSVVKLENIALVDESFNYGEGATGSGMPGTYQWTFQALKKGPGSIQFARYRPFDFSDICYDEVLPFDVVTKTADALNQVGGWSEFSEPSETQKNLLTDALNGRKGITYTPLLVSSQTLAEKQVLFVANAQMSTLHPQPYPVLIRLSVPNFQRPKIGIRVLGHLGFAGAPEKFESFNKVDVKKLIQDACNQWLGGDFTLLAVSKQITNGTMCLVAANVKDVYCGAKENRRPVFISFHIPSGENPQAQIVFIKDIFEF